MRKVTFLFLVLSMCFWGYAQKYSFNGLDMNMGNLSRLSDAKTRSIRKRRYGRSGKR